MRELPLHPSPLIIDDRSVIIDPNDALNSERQLVVTGDGSHSLYIPALHEHYHSWKGALQESVYIFIERGMKPASEGKSRISILEMGLGTGLNCFLSWLEHRQSGVEVSYTALETYPLGTELAAQLNYPQTICAEEHKDTFMRLHGLPWNEWTELSPGFRLQKLHLPLQEFRTTDTYDVVYYDAFAPSKQPELWTEEVFQTLAGLMKPGALLVTYCAKGDVRRAMLAAGLDAKRLPGPPGKREMLRAEKKTE